MKEKIVIIDFGSQYTQLIARRIREMKVYSEVIQPNDVDKTIGSSSSHVKGIILSGGPRSVNLPDATDVSAQIFSKKIPILGICYGMQLIARHFDGKVRSSEKREYGHTTVKILKQSSLFKTIPQKITVWMSHGDDVRILPKGSVETAETENRVCAAFEFSKEKIYALQFHVEVTQTEYGMQILKNFVFDICGCESGWSLEDFVTSRIENIKEEMGNERAICALSGGVDSTVAAVMVNKAIGNRLLAVLVDHGFMRKEEVEDVRRYMQNRLGLNLKVVDASKEFLDVLKGVTNPEEKRKRIGEQFIRAFERESARAGEIKYLVQGTIYSDVIESAASGSTMISRIKSHHNVGGLPKEMNLKIIEPLRTLFKDEVRRIGKILGIPEQILNRQPFPGPGIAIRIIGEITPERIEIVREADAIFREVLEERGWMGKIWQSFAVLLPLRSVGVTGDERTYGCVVALRAVNSVEGMTASWSEIPLDILKKASKRITNEIKGVNRVVYDITDKPPATIEWE